MHHTVHRVGIVGVVDGQARAAVLERGVDHMRERRVRSDADDVGPRDHDAARGRVVELEDGEDHSPLAGVEHRVLGIDATLLVVALPRLVIRRLSGGVEELERPGDERDDTTCGSCEHETGALRAVADQGSSEQRREDDGRHDRGERRAEVGQGCGDADGDRGEDAHDRSDPVRDERSLRQPQQCVGAAHAIVGEAERTQRVDLAHDRGHRCGEHREDDRHGGDGDLDGVHARPAPLRCAASSSSVSVNIARSSSGSAWSIPSRCRIPCTVSSCSSECSVTPRSRA